MHLNLCSGSLVFPAGTNLYRSLTNAINNGDGTESANIAAGDLQTSDKIGNRFSILRYCRLGSDTIDLTWIGPCVATIKTLIREDIAYPA
jgi:hypothetical protein